jgi:phosphate butyryltransferase
VAKTFMLAAKAMMSGLIVGAKVPIVLVSRSATAEEKYWSLVFAAAAAK